MQLAFLYGSLGPCGLLPHLELRQEGQMPSEAFNCRRMPPVRQHCRRGAPNQGIRLRQFKTIERSASIQRYTLLERTKKKGGLWRDVERAHRFFCYFLGQWGPWGPGPPPPRARAQGPRAHLSELDGDRRESVCNSAVLGVKTCFTAILCDVGRV